MTASSLSERVLAIRHEIQRARSDLSLGDAKSCGWRARRATESMLHVLCDLNEITPPAKAPNASTLGTLRQALRHANVMDRRMEDHVAHIQNIGNRAAHAQAHQHLEVDQHDAESLMPALQRLWVCFVGHLPEDVYDALQTIEASPNDTVRPAEDDDDVFFDDDEDDDNGTWNADEPTPRSLTRWLWLPLLVAAPFVTFKFMVALLPLFQPPRVDPPAIEEPAFLDAAALDAMLADEGADVAHPNAYATFDKAADAIRFGHSVHHVGIEDLACYQLNVLRNGVWAAKGYVFKTQDARDQFEGRTGYIARPDMSLREIERLFDEASVANLTYLDGLMQRRGCPCPKPGKQRPCPE